MTPAKTGVCQAVEERLAFRARVVDIKPAAVGLEYPSEDLLGLVVVVVVVVVVVAAAAAAAV